LVTGQNQMLTTQVMAMARDVLAALRKATA
jgi:hypothetical protein